MSAEAQAIAVTRPAAAARPSFFGSVRGEALKMRRQLSLWLMLLGGALLFLLVFLIEVSAPFAKSERPAAQYADTAINVFSVLYNTGSGIILLILSSRLVGMEYSSGTIRVQLGRGVGRLQLLFAKLVALALFGLLLLAGYLVISTIALYAMAQIAGRTWSSISAVPHLLTDVELYASVALISMTCCILLGAFTSTIGRSLAFGISAAMAFFPADNFGPLILFLVNRLTNNDFWLKVTSYLLGPNLNGLSGVLITDFPSRGPFGGPLVKVDATHSLIVIAVFCLVFLVTSVVLTVRRDVLQ